MNDGNRFERWFWKIANIITFPVWGVLTIPLVFVAIISTAIDMEECTDDEKDKRSKLVQRNIIQALLWLMGFAAVKYMGWI